MLSTLHAYISGLPADDALVASVLCAITPVVFFIAAGFEARRAADRAAARSWGR